VIGLALVLVGVGGVAIGSALSLRTLARDHQALEVGRLRLDVDRCQLEHDREQLRRAQREHYEQVAAAIVRQVNAEARKAAPARKVGVLQ
jgi:adenylate kinase